MVARQRLVLGLLGLKSAQVKALLGVALWLLVGTCVYTYGGFKELEHSSLAAGFFHAVNAGLAVGDGKLTPRSDAVQLFTAPYVVCGAALGAGALSTFIVDALEAAEEVIGGRRSPPLQRDIRAWTVQAVAFLAGWFCIGVTFGRLHEGFGWTTAVLFALSGTSTIGIQAISSEDSLSFLFCALYCLVGVPLYTVTVGRISLLIASIALERRQKEIRRRGAAVVEDCDEACLVDLFDTFDQDRSGTIEPWELTPLLRFLTLQTNMQVTDEDKTFMMEEFDGNRDGLIQKAEFIHGLQKWLRWRKPRQQQQQQQQQQEQQRQWRQLLRRVPAAKAASAPGEEKEEGAARAAATAAAAAAV